MYLRTVRTPVCFPKNGGEHMNARQLFDLPCILLDGGSGSFLQKAGLKSGELPETWNLTHPDVIRALHRAYFDAGSNIVLTNTFGANCLKHTPDALERIVREAVCHVREASAQSTGDQPRFAALDLGPSGRLLQPFGDFTLEEAVDLYKATLRYALKEGVDLVCIETMNDLLETKAALLAVKESCDLPVFVSNAYGEDGRLMTGATPEIMVDLLESMGADCIGVNCSYGPDVMGPVISEYLRLAHVPVLFKPNAGLPRVSETGETVYSLDPESFSRQMEPWVRRGVRAAGGCCGTTPDHIRQLRSRLSGIRPDTTHPEDAVRVTSNTRSVTFQTRPLLIGERINPTGKKAMKAALQAGDMNYLLREAIGQEEHGCDILDVNVGMPGIDEVHVLKQAAEEIQAVTGLPLQIDTSSAAAMEAALRTYRGKPLINSVNGKQESMDAIFPLMKKYGGVAIALTLDDSGIPDTADGRVRIARRILENAAAHGIPAHNLIFDPLAMTISADERAAMVTLETLRRIHDELGGKTCLGVSNVSFGLPARDGINSVYFALAMEHGLSCAIMNPYSQPMMQTYRAFLALHGLDSRCLEYIAFMQAHPAPSASAPALPEQPSESASAMSPLGHAILHGLRTESARLTQELLKQQEGLDIINREIVPVLNQAGEAFEKHTLFLPQLLMCAEAATAAFDEIRLQAGPKDASEDHVPVVIATVKGDIHDIGKNIVRLMLESYGFPVTDLGKDTAPETILQAVLEKHAPICGLSALMTTTVPAMEETIRLLHEKAPFCHVMVGGAVLTQAYADRIGADSYARDAMAAVRCAQQAEAEYRKEKD